MVQIMKLSIQACSCESLKLEGECWSLHDLRVLGGYSRRGADQLWSIMKDEEAITNAASRVRWLVLQSEASCHEGFSNMVVTHEEEAAKTQLVSIKEDLVVRALDHTKTMLWERGRDQDLSKEEYKKCWWWARGVGSILHHMRAMIQSLCVPYIVGKAQRLTGQSLGLGDFTLFPSSRFCPKGFSLVRFLMRKFFKVPSLT